MNTILPLDTCTSADVPIPAPLSIDLRGRGRFEVMALLRKHGFGVGTADMSSIWSGYAPPKPHPKAELIGTHVVWINDRQAPMLTVTIFNGKSVTLNAGKDLHVFERPDGNGADWGTYKTLNIMR